MFRAQIVNGNLKFGPRVLDKFKEWMAGQEGKFVKIELDIPLRSNQQNRYYWMYLAIIERETGENADDLHEFFRRKLLPPEWKTIRGEEVKLPRSTTTLDKFEFGEYLDKISALTEIPLPNPEDAGYFPNYPYVPNYNLQKRS
jgi:hypothetical protein